MRLSCGPFSQRATCRTSVRLLSPATQKYPSTFTQSPALAANVAMAGSRPGGHGDLGFRAGARSDSEPGHSAGGKISARFGLSGQSRYRSPDAGTMGDHDGVLSARLLGDGSQGPADPGGQLVAGLPRREPLAELPGSPSGQRGLVNLPRVVVVASVQVAHVDLAQVVEL